MNSVTSVNVSELLVNSGPCLTSTQDDRLDWRVAVITCLYDARPTEQRAASMNIRRVHF